MWTTTRNIHINEASGNRRSAQVLFVLKEVLIADSWELIAYGVGDYAGEYSKRQPMTDPFGNVSDVGFYAWVVLRNGSGHEVCIQDLWGELEIAWTATHSFLAPSAWSHANCSSRPRAGTGEAVVGNDYPNVGQSSAYYLSIATTEDSFIVFGVIGPNNNLGIALIKTSGREDDPDPYWSYVCTGVQAWSRTGTVSSLTGTTNARHPGTDTPVSCPLAVPSVGTTAFTSHVTDPNTGGFQVCSPLAVTAGAVGFYPRHIKGAVDGVYPVSTSFSEAVAIMNNNYIRIRDFCFPWGSAEAMS